MMNSCCSSTTTVLCHCNNLPSSWSTSLCHTLEHTSAIATDLTKTWPASTTSVVFPDEHYSCRPFGGTEICTIDFHSLHTSQILACRVQNYLLVQCDTSLKWTVHGRSWTVMDGPDLDLILNSPEISHELSCLILVWIVFHIRPGDDNFSISWISLGPIICITHSSSCSNWGFGDDEFGGVNSLEVFHFRRLKILYYQDRDDL